MTDKTDFEAAPSASAGDWENTGSDLHETVMDDSGGFPPAGEAELMLEEFTHRVNNELASLLGAATLEMALAHDPSGKAALRRVRSRLMNVSRLHQALQPWKGDAQIDAGEHLRGLCEALQQGVLGNVTLQFSGGHCLLPAQRCWRLGMAVAELVANAQRHAFRGGRGTVRVELRSLGGHARCTVADDGAGSAGLVPGRGLRIVAALVRGLSGELRHRSRGTGTAWTITMPVHAFCADGPSAAPPASRNAQPAPGQAVCL